MENKEKPLSNRDPLWRSHVLDYFTKYDYKESLRQSLKYRKELPSRPEIFEEMTPKDWVTIDYTIAVSAYEVMRHSAEIDEENWNIFFEYFGKYLETIGSFPNNKEGLNSSNMGLLIECSLKLFIYFKPIEIERLARQCVMEALSAWNEKVVLSALMKTIFEERMDFRHSDVMRCVRVLSELYLDIASNYGERYYSEQSAIMNILSDLTYFFEGRGEESERKALEWLEKSLNLSPNDKFAIQRRDSIIRNLAVNEQIRRYNHDVNNEIGGLFSTIKKLQDLLDKTADHEAEVCISRIEYGLHKIGGVHRFLQKQEPLFKIVPLYPLVKQVAAGYEGASIDIIGDPKSEVEIDGDYLGLSVDNLLKNSMEAFVRQQIPESIRRITINFRTNKDFFEIRISDNAGGIDPSMREHIFDLYVSSKGIKGNTGLGLYNARQAVQRMGGNLTLTPSQPEDGAEFIIEIPQ